MSWLVWKPDWYCLFFYAFILLRMRIMIYSTNMLKTAQLWTWLFKINHSFLLFTAKYLNEYWTMVFLKIAAANILITSFKDLYELFSGSSRPDVFCKKASLKHFVKFTWKHLCQGLIFQKTAACRLATFLKGDSCTSIFL